MFALQTHVLTAAHVCRAMSQRSTLAVAGEFELDANDGSEQSIEVESFVRHEGYDDFSYNNDICLVTLAEPLEFNE